MKDRHIHTFNEHNSGLSDDIDSPSKWNIIPSKCIYNGKVYRILNIDMQGGYFTLQDIESQKGDVQVLDDIDMEQCDLIN